METTMNPETRTILQVSLEDAIQADEIFTTLMGIRFNPEESLSKRMQKKYRTWISSKGVRNEWQKKTIVILNKLT